jgi:hypothetical protein
MQAARVAEPVHREVVDAATELMTAGGVTRNPHVRISDQIADLLSTNRLAPEQVTAILEKHGVTYEQFAAIWRADVAQNARDLARLGVAQRRLQSFYKTLTPAERGALDGALEHEGLDTTTAAASLWKRLDNVRRAALVVQPATAMRNLETQMGRVGLDTFEKLIDEALQVATGRKGLSDVHPAQVFAVQLRLFQKNRKLADGILQYFPAEGDRLFLRYASDLANRGAGEKVLGGGIQKAEEAVHWLNGMNRFQEFVIRRAVFLGELERVVAARGMGTLAELEAAGRLGTIVKEDLAAAVGKSLEMTFARNYSPTSLAGHFIGFVNKMPLLTLPVPFPRFLMNSVEFVFDWNPTGFLKLLSPAERARVAAGDFSTIARATTGSAMLLGAYQLRNSDWAGERWYEIRGPDGRNIDMRPFNPFAAWLFIGDLIKRAKDGTLQQMDAKDIAMGVLSVNVRAGTGLALLDQLLNGLSGLNDEDKIKRFAAEIGGETLSGPFVFLQPLRDLVAQFDDKERILRDTSNAPFFGPFLRKIPYGTRGFPEAELPTRAGPPVTQAPLLRQGTGIILRQPKNPLEAELDRLGFRWSDYAPRTGDPEADRQINSYLGPLAEAALVPMVSAPAWRALGDRTKAAMLMRSYQQLRKTARGLAAKGDPLRFERLRLKRLPKRDRRMMRELGQDPVELLDRMMETNP